MKFDRCGQTIQDLVPRGAGNVYTFVHNCVRLSMAKLPLECISPRLSKTHPVQRSSWQLPEPAMHMSSDDFDVKAQMLQSDWSNRFQEC